MILLTRLNGPVFALNPDLVERAEETPDTVITLVDGTKYLVEQSLSEFVALVRQCHAERLADAEIVVSSGTRRRMENNPQPTNAKTAKSTADGSRVVRLPRKES